MWKINFIAAKTKTKAKANGKSSDTESESDDSVSEVSSDEISTPSESESENSFIDGKAASKDDEDESDESDSDLDKDMVRARPRADRQRATTGNKKQKTMQDKVNELVKPKLTDGSPTIKLHTLNCCKKACDLKDELLDGIEMLGDRLPVNTLDQLIYELGKYSIRFRFPFSDLGDFWMIFDILTRNVSNSQVDHKK